MALVTLTPMHGPQPTDFTRGRLAASATLTVNGLLVCAHEPAFIDAGADATTISEGLVSHIPWDDEITFDGMRGLQPSYVYRDCSVLIDGFDAPLALALHTRPRLPARMRILIGRDLLRHCRLVVDPPGADLYAGAKVRCRPAYRLDASASLISLSSASETVGNCRSSRPIVSTTTPATTKYANHLLSAGTTYQGASRVLVWRITSS